MAAPQVLGTADWTLFARLPQVSGTMLTYQEIWRGPYSTISTKVAALYAAGATDISTAKGGAVATITATYGVPVGGVHSDPIDTVWQVTPYDVENNLRLMPKFTADSGFGAWVADHADKAITDGKTGLLDYTGLPANFADYVNMRLAGVDSYRRTMFNVTKTVTYYKDATVDLSLYYAVVGNVIAWADIPDIATSGLTEPFSTDGTSYHILKWWVGGPSVQKSKKTQTITYTWQGSLGYMSFLYPGGNLNTKGQ